MMPTSFQKEIFSPAPPGKTKIVISTNIAETSVTIEDVVYVIDAGMIKSTTYDPDASVSILAPELVSKANARQRAGRAGRVRPGICFHLFSSFAEESMTEYLKPEMLRTPLEEVCLQIKLLRRGMVFPFLDKAMNPPPQAVVARAVKNLTLMHALDEDEDITTLGYHLARMNVDPHTGKMILYGALFSCLDPILTIAASLGYRDPFVMPMGKEKEADEARYRLGEGLFSDHFMLYNAFTRWDNIPNPAAANDFAWGNFLAPQVLKMLKDMKRDFAGNLQSIGFLSSSDPKDFQANANSGNVDLIKAVVCAGLYPQVAYLHQRTFKGFRPKTGLIKNDGVSRSVAVHMKSVLNREKNFASPWLVYHQLLVTSKSYLFDATMVSHFPLLFFGGQIEKGVENDQQFIVIDDWIKFWADHSVANSVIELRVQLINILARKINNPRMVSWTDGERAILEAIIALVTTNTFGCFEEDYDEEVLDGYHEAYDPARY